MIRSSFRVPSLPALALLLSLAAGCGSTATEPPSRASITEETLGEATVVAVEKSSREITLERADGKRMVVVAGPEVRNLDGIEAGMKVKSRSSVTLTVRRLAADEPDTPPTAGAVAARARLGEKPGGGIAAGLVVTVKVETIDLEQHIVTFTDPDGALRVVKAQREEGRRFVDGLKKGDRVEIQYTEGVLLSVE